MDTLQLWQSVLGELEVSLSKPNFITWFRDTFIAEISENKVIIGVPNTFTKAWLEKKYEKTISEVLKNMLKQPKLQTIFRVETNKNIQPKINFNVNISSPINNTNPNPSSSVIDTVFIPQENNKTNNINPRYTFTNYVVGKGNELAHAACQAVINKLGSVYNPLFLYGGVGLGKTHLMHALGNAILAINPKTKILYITTETFTNEFISSIKEGRANDFKEKYRTSDVLLIDDIQFISGKEQTQEAFFHIFNELHQSNKQIVISSDRPPKSITALESRLSSRFEWGMIADILNPDLETRIAILDEKCKNKNYSMDREIVNYIATNIQNNVRELEGALNKIIAVHQLNNTSPTIESVKQLLNSLIKTAKKNAVTSKSILKIISNFYGVSMEELLGSSREKRFVVPRQITMYLMRTELKSSFPSIGNELGGRDHTTAMHACDKIGKEIKNNDHIKNDIELLKQKLTEEVVV